MTSSTNGRLKAPLVIFGHTLPITRLVAVLHLVIALYALSFWIQIGVNPWLTKKLGVDSTTYGYLETTFALLQLCGGPLFGRFGDLYGGRSALLLAYLSSTLMYVLLGLADSIPLLFLAKLPSLFMHSMQGGQMLATDLSTDSDRADALGKLGVSYGVGMVLGPLIGGFVTQRYSPRCAALVAAVLSALCVLSVFLFVPPRTKKVAVEDEGDGAAPTSNRSGIASNFQAITKLMNYPRVPFLLFVRVVTGIPLGVIQSMFSLVSIETFGADPKTSGYVLSYIGLLSLAMQGFGVGLMTRRFSDGLLLKIGACSVIPYYLGFACWTAFYQIYFLVPFVVFATAVMNVVVTSSLTKSVSSSDTGTILGLNMATNALVRSVSPTIGGLLFANYGHSSFGFFGLGTTILVLGPLLFRSSG